jgi:hypothetical protein
VTEVAITRGAVVEYIVVCDPSSGTFSGTVMQDILIDQLRIADDGQLFISPVLAEGDDFALIYRTASGVNWDEPTRSLYCPKPREWSYGRWFEHACEAVAGEYNRRLVIGETTDWNNCPANLRAQIESLFDQ